MVRCVQDGALCTLYGRPVVGMPAYRTFLVPLQALQLALACLSFDFVGTCVDEASDELGTIQVGSLR